MIDEKEILRVHIQRRIINGASPQGLYQALRDTLAEIDATKLHDERETG